MNSAKDSTQTPENYAGLSLSAIHSVVSEDAVIEAQKKTYSDDVRVELPQGNQAQGEKLQNERTSLPPPSESSMQDYYQLQHNLLGLTVAFGAVIFPFVWGVYSLQIALDYVLGACAGVVYLRMLGRNVSSIGRDKKNSSAGRLAVFAGIMIVALRWNQLDVIPVFLGFLTYKAAIIAFVLWTSVKPSKKVV